MHCTEYHLVITIILLSYVHQNICLTYLLTYLLNRGVADVFVVNALMPAAAAAATAVLYALTDGGYSDDAELAFIQCFLQDDRLQALLRVSCRRNTFLADPRWNFIGIFGDGKLHSLGNHIMLFA